MGKVAGRQVRPPELAGGRLAHFPACEKRAAVGEHRGAEVASQGQALRELGADVSRALPGREGVPRAPEGVPGGGCRRRGGGVSGRLAVDASRRRGTRRGCVCAADAPPRGLQQSPRSRRDVCRSQPVPVPRQPEGPERQGGDPVPSPVDGQRGGQASGDARAGARAGARPRARERQAHPRQELLQAPPTGLRPRAQGDGDSGRVRQRVVRGPVPQQGHGEVVEGGDFAEEAGPQRRGRRVRGGGAGPVFAADPESGRVAHVRLDPDRDDLVVRGPRQARGQSLQPARQALERRPR